MTLVGSRAITLFLWHQTAMVAAVGATYPTGLWPATARVDLMWWLTRPVWFALLAAVLALLVGAFGRFERTSPPGRRAVSGATGTTVTLLGVALATAGLALLALRGLYAPGGRLPLSLLPLGLLLAGLVALGAISTPGFRDVRRVDSPRPEGPSTPDSPAR